MNWLAHLHLTHPTPAGRLGALLPDIDRSSRKDPTLDAETQTAIDLHRHIDRFTDTHPIVFRSRGRLEPPYRRYAAILIDLFYDHFLSITWHTHHPQPLRQFIDECYRELQIESHCRPHPIPLVFERMGEEDWLGAYLSINGMGLACRRVSNRLKRPNLLVGAENELARCHDALHEDFDMFYAQLQTEIDRWKSTPPINL